MGQNRMEKGKMELLAPAGSYETLKAVIEAGADAVYLGGPAFGARAYASNFTKEELLEALDYAHMRGVKVYLTVNTLLKNQEISGLVEYLKPFYERGLDAVLVQDFGALSIISRHFSDMEIHTSTQMTITGPEGVEFLKNYHVSRVVMAREVSLPEMKQIHRQTGMELEAFVHGALCYCYSGQCLFSSMLGGRSGNRGRCAQPCRLSYTPLENSGKPIRKESFCISLKDMCGVEDLKALYDAGVYSLKIEGRMKSPDYAAGVVSIYRKYIDQMLESSKGAQIKISKNDMNHLADLGSRCGFTDAYYRRQNGSDMVTFEKPNLEYKNPSYHDQILERYVKQQSKIRVSGRVTILQDQPSMLEVWKDDSYYCATGQTAMEALKKPMSEEEVADRMKKTGDTSFVFDSMEVHLDPGLFLPNGVLNQLRREGISGLSAMLLEPYRRTYQAPSDSPVTDVPKMQTALDSMNSNNPAAGSSSDHKFSIRTLAESRLQMEQLLQWQPDKLTHDIIYVEASLYSDSSAMWKRDLEKAHAHGKKLYLALYHIFRKQGQKSLSRLLNEIKISGSGMPDGYLVRNYEEISFLKQFHPEATIIADHNLYTYNDYSIKAFLQSGIRQVTMPLELNAGEIAARENDHTEMIVYGHYPLMTSAQCVHANTGKCDHNSQLIWLKDRYKTSFPVRNYCCACYNIIYNSLPVCLFGQIIRLQKSGVTTFRLQFTIEDAKATQAILSMLEQTLEEKMTQKEISALGTFTNGHYKRGVE